MKKLLDDKKFHKYNITYMIPRINNIDLLAAEANKTIIEEVKKSDLYSLMADTTPDVLYQDQLSVCL